MHTLITTSSVRTVAALLTGTSATVRSAASDVEDVTVVTCRDEDATLVVTLMRRAGLWLDRVNTPRPPRGGTRPSRVVDPIPVPIVATPALVAASDHERSFAMAFTPEMESLVRRSQRR